MKTKTVGLHQIGEQKYEDSKLSAGLVDGHPDDTIYLKLERDDEDSTTILLREDEALSIIWLLSGALWSEAMSSMEDE